MKNNHFLSWNLFDILYSCAWFAWAFKNSFSWWQVDMKDEVKEQARSAGPIQSHQFYTTTTTAQPNQCKSFLFFVDKSECISEILNWYVHSICLNVERQEGALLVGIFYNLCGAWQVTGWILILPAVHSFADGDFSCILCCISFWQTWCSL